MSSGKEIRDLNKIYLEAVYGQSAGQKLEKREKDDDAAGAPKKATPASGTGKYYKEGKPTDQQLAQRAKREKIKQLTNQGKHKEASALHKEDYETQKKKEVLSALDRDKRSLSKKDKEKIANKVVTSKGDTSKSDDRYAYEEVQVEGALVKAAKGVEAVGGAIGKGVKAFNKADRAVTKATMKVAKPVAKAVGKGVKKVAAATARGAAGAVAGAVRGVKKGLSEEQLELQNIRALVEKEVKVKDTKKVVDAIRAYDKSKDASRDATADSDEGDTEKADIEKKYAAKERGEIDKDDPNWKKRKYHTGIHGEEVEILKGLLESGKLSEEEVKSILWEGYQRNPEEGERKERESAKKREAIPGQARRGMPPRGDKKREEFERWYAANVR